MRPDFESWWAGAFEHFRLVAGRQQAVALIGASDQVRALKRIAASDWADIMSPSPRRWRRRKRLAVIELPVVTQIPAEWRRKTYRQRAAERARRAKLRAKRHA